MAQVRTRKRGKTFSYIFEAGKQGGKRKVVEKGGYPTRSAAYKAGVEAYTDWLHGNIGITSESISLADFMTHWLNNVVAVNVKPTSMQTYRYFFTKHIAPYLGEVKVQELTPAMIDTWLRKLLRAGLSRNVLSATRALLCHALNCAVYPAQLISSNPAAFIKVPKNAPRNVVKRTIITPEQYKALLAKYPFGSPLHIPLMLLYHTGMRLGEVLGLSWSDIDFAAKRINLRRQIVYLNKRGYFFSTLKTESSKRYVLIDNYLLRELRLWQARQTENEKALGGRYVAVYREDDGYVVRQAKSLPPLDAEIVSLVCTCNDGQVVARRTVMRILHAFGLNSHSFRHTHTTVLAENGVPAKAIAGRLGHANPQITQDLYTHNTLKMQEEAATVFAQSLQITSCGRQLADESATRSLALKETH